MRITAVMTVLAIAIVPAIADEIAIDELGRQLIDEFVTDIATLQGRFDQSLIDVDGTVVEEATGLLEIQRPGRFRWSNVEPYEQVLVADGLNIWSYDVDLAQVTVKPQADALSNTPALLLGGSRDALDEFVHEKTIVEKEMTWVWLRPRNTESGFLRVELGFSDDRIRRMVFFDNLEQTTVVTLHDVIINEPIAADRFEFDVPDDVDVVGSPAVADALMP